MNDSKELWIQVGYETAALKGLQAIKIESLAKKVGISKSSFYHHFADLELFTEYLLKHHIGQSYLMAEKERQAKNIFPELIEVLLEHKIDLLFNRQLRINRNHLAFEAVLAKSNAIVGNSFVMVWVKDLNLQLKPKQLEAIFELALENFFLQINPDNLSRAWLIDYFTNLKRIAANFATGGLDGSV